ncbi:MAG: hypothetical protein ABFC89_05480 [Methanospirillum sp.]
MNDYRNGFAPGAALIAAAALLLLVAALTGRGDMTSATLVLVGVGCFIGGVFILTQYQGESAPPWFAGVAAADPVIDLTRFCADLGLQGDAHLFLRDRQIIQVVPVGDAPPTVLPPDDYTFISEGYGGGIQMVPPGKAIYDRLVREHSLAVPHEMAGFCKAVREVGEDALDLARKVEIVPEGDLIEVRLSGYRFFDGCNAIRTVSPKCCTMIGCPTCSLFACMAVAGLARPCKIEHVSTDEKDRSVRLILRSLD